MQRRSGFLVRLFEARTLLEDVAIIARLRRFGVANDTVFSRSGARVSREELETICGRGALRLVQLDAIEVDTVDEAPHILEMFEHSGALDDVRELLDRLVAITSGNDQRATNSVLTEICARLPQLPEHLHRLVSAPVIDHAGAPELDALTRRYQSLLPALGDIADEVRARAPKMDKEELEGLEPGVLAMEHLLEQHALFSPKPIYNHQAYEAWLMDIEDAQFRVRETLQQLLKARLDR